MRNLLSLFSTPRRRHAACDNFAISLRVRAYAAAYALERRGQEQETSAQPARLSRSSLAWACGDINQMEVVRG